MEVPMEAWQKKSHGCITDLPREGPYLHGSKKHHESTMESLQMTSWKRHGSPTKVPWKHHGSTTKVPKGKHHGNMEVSRTHNGSPTGVPRKSLKAPWKYRGSIAK